MSFSQNFPRTAGSPDDFPGNGFALRGQLDFRVTDRLCEECGGVRGAVTHVFGMVEAEFEVDGVPMNFEVFADQYPQTAALFREVLNIDQFGNPTCIACQEDFRMQAKRVLGSVNIFSGRA
jgi:hypothetical protein